MWIAQIMDKGYNNGTLSVTVLFTDGKINAVKTEDGKDKFLGDPEAHQHEAIFRTDNPSSTWLQDNIDATFKRLASLDSVAGTIAVGQKFEAV